MPENEHYRFCFSCDKWKSNKEINEVDLGGGNKTYNCNVCRKNLGENIQIFKCPKHDNKILKVWGTCEGQNKEKIFYDKCPQEDNQEQNPPNKDNRMSKGTIALIVVLVILVAIFFSWVIWKGKRTDAPWTKYPIKRG